MNVYFIYQKREGFTPFLYAYTEKKSIKDRFKDERNMSLFSITKNELSKKDLYRFEMDHRAYHLDVRAFETSTVIDDSVKRSHVYLVATELEEMSVFTNSDKIIEEIAKHTSSISKAFNKELLEALNTLYYFEIYKYKHAFDYFVSGVYGFKPTTNDGLYRLDSFSVFYKLYGNTLKEV